MDRSVERATQNELRFREANEEIEERRVELGVDGVRVPYLCECEDPACRELVRLSAAEYRSARLSERHFLLADGHPFRSGEIVGDHDGYVVVEKGGEAGSVIEREESARG
jgi:hypothetical protein